MNLLIIQILVSFGLNILKNPICNFWAIIGKYKNESSSPRIKTIYIPKFNNPDCQSDTVRLKYLSETHKNMHVHLTLPLPDCTTNIQRSEFNSSIKHVNVIWFKFQKNQKKKKINKIVRTHPFSWCA